MSNRLVPAAVLFACAFALDAQENMFKIDLVPSGSMVALNEPSLQGDVYVFRAWPDGASTNLPRMRVRMITRVTRATPDNAYRVDLNPSGVMFARDVPKLKGNMYLFHRWRDGTLMSVRKADLRQITALTDDQALSTEMRMKGEVEIGNLAMQGGSSQAGLANASSVAAPKPGGPALGQGFYSSIVPGQTIGAPNSPNDYQVGRTFAGPPPNAVQSSPGAPPTAPAATSGQNPPQ
jgi:hypothetical protein